MDRNASICLILVGLCLFGCQTTNVSPDNDLGSFFACRDVSLPEAERMTACKQAVLLQDIDDETLADIHANIAFGQLRALAYEDAIESLNRAILLDSTNFSHFRDRGRVYFHLEMYREAVSDYDEAIRLNELSYYSYLGRAKVHHQLGNYTLAKKDFDVVVDRNDGLSERYNIDPSLAYQERGAFFFGYREYSKATVDLEAAVDRNPQNSIAHIYLALLHSHFDDDTQNFEVALEHATRAVRYGDVPLHLGVLAYVKGLVGSESDALSNLEKSAKAGGKQLVKLYQKALSRKGFYGDTINGNLNTETKAGFLECIERRCAPFLYWFEETSSYG